jgi:hypothetical protein
MSRNCTLCHVPLFILVLCAVSAPATTSAAARASNAQASTESIELYVECLANAGIEPRICYSNEPIYAVLKSSTDVDYLVCHMEPPPNPERCTEPQHAKAGTPSPVPAAPEVGVHSLIWKYSATGVEIGSVQYSVEEPPGILYAGGASDQFSYRIHRRITEAFFPKNQRHSKACRKVYVRPSGRIAVCFIEYVKDGEWHLLREVENIPPALNEIVLKTVSDRAWRRETVRCPLPSGVSGKLISNNGCGRAMPYSDSQLVAGQLLPNIRAGKPLEYISWRPILGPSSLAIFSGHRVGNSLRFNNQVEDWFAYTP